MTRYTWRIDHLRKYSSLGEHSDIVYEVGYTCIGENRHGTIRTNYSIGGKLTLSTDNLSNPISYGDLTEEIVLDWLSPVKTDTENLVEAEITGNDETYIRNLPWRS